MNDAHNQKVIEFVNTISELVSENKIDSNDILLDIIDLYNDKKSHNLGNMDVESDYESDFKEQVSSFKKDFTKLNNEYILCVNDKKYFTVEKKYNCKFLLV